LETKFLKDIRFSIVCLDLEKCHSGSDDDLLGKLVNYREFEKQFQFKGGGGHFTGSFLTGAE